MNFNNQLLVIFIISAFIFSCSSSEENNTDEQPIASGNKELTTLTLEYNNSEYQTSTSGTNVSNNNLLPFLANRLKVKSFQISPNAAISINVGQSLNVNDSPIPITITAENNTTKVYNLTLNKNEGLQIESNTNIEFGSSNTLQNSDVYVDGSQLTQDFNRFFLNAYADFNNDGNTDVLLSAGLFQSIEYSPIYLYHGDGTGINMNYCECGGACSGFVCNSFTEFDIALPNNYEGLQHPRKILIGDYNGDNLKDAFIIGTGYDATPFPGESPVLLLNNGNGFEYNKLNGISGFYHGGSSADFDNDGDLDIFLIGNPSDFESVFLINDGLGNFNQTSEFIDEEFHHNTKYYTSEFIDIISDGFIDLLIAGHEHEGAISSILWGNSSGKYYKELSTILPQVAGYNIVVDIDANDIDNDGDKDIVLNRVDSNNFYQNYLIQIIENVENNTFLDMTSESINNNTGNDWYIWLHLQDLNNDGVADIYLENDHRTNLKWFNDGNGNFNL